MTKEELLKKIEFELKMANSTLGKFAKDLIENPAHAMDWSDHVFAAAATVDVMTYVQGGLTGEGKATPEKVAEFALDHAMRKARGGSSQSTSSGHNQMERARTAVWAELYHSITTGM